MQLIGVNECTKRINDLILRAKEAAGIDPKSQLICIVSGHLFWQLCALLLLECSVSVLPLSSCQGLSLSGADQMEALYNFQHNRKSFMNHSDHMNFPSVLHVCTNTYGFLYIATSMPRGSYCAVCVCVCGVHIHVINIFVHFSTQ